MRTGTVVGVEALPVDVEVDVGAGLPSFSIVGLPDAAVQEARERVRSALRASSFALPNARIVVNLAPGPLRKHGTGFDLPIAIGLLLATGQLPAAGLSEIHTVGELSLTGGVRPVPGLIAHALAARAAGRSLLGPVDSTAAASVDGLEYLPLKHLSLLRAGLPAPAGHAQRTVDAAHDVDFAEVVGQELALRALVIAAAGAHNVLMVGPPGSGKTMLLEAVPVDPPTASQGGAARDRARALRGRSRHLGRPRRATAVSRAAPLRVRPRARRRRESRCDRERRASRTTECSSSTRCPSSPRLRCSACASRSRTGIISVVRADGRLTFPARFTLVGAANPCRCGFLGDPGRSCTCQPWEIDRYRSRIGGPLMDRIDLVVNVDRPEPGAMLTSSRGPSSAAAQGAWSWPRASALPSEPDPATPLTGAALLQSCRLDSKTRGALERAARRHHLSGRGVTRLLRVGRTIADIEGDSAVTTDHLAEAIGYRAAGSP